MEENENEIEKDFVSTGWFRQLGSPPSELAMVMYVHCEMEMEMAKVMEMVIVEAAWVSPCVLLE